MLCPCPDKDICPLMIDREQLNQNGYQLLRQAVPSGWLYELRATFEAGGDCAQGLYEAHLQTLGLRFVRMDTSERFEPADFV